MLQSKEGQLVPDVTFTIMENGQWKEITTAELFDNKTVIVFELPGAFTPTCSSSHVPRYNELAEVFKHHGIDNIICMSVNDTFVMNAWKEDQDAENITFIPDGNGEFAEGLGMLVDKKELGFGKRSWRYSMLVKNRKIEKMFVEPEKPGDPFEVSDADTMLNYIAPNAGKTKEVSIFTKPGCPHCARAKALLDQKNQPYHEIVLGEQASVQSMRAISGKQTVPQVFIDGKHIGGADELEVYYQS